ncbi:unnamed protein product [Larinioides sclopetarius]|uniref:Uncharacterized protein n=1 Tax=Larinioides sclopetarius TaxID=280406 RepID=A0AAV2C2X2_9ARAC
MTLSMFFFVLQTIDVPDGCFLHLSCIARMTLPMFSSSHKPSTSRTAAFFIYQYSTAPRMATRKLTNLRRPGRLRSSSINIPRHQEWLRGNLQTIDVPDGCVLHLSIFHGTKNGYEETYKPSTSRTGAFFISPLPSDRHHRRLRFSILQGTEHRGHSSSFPPATDITKDYY